MTCPAGRCSSASWPLPARAWSPLRPPRPTPRRPPPAAPAPFGYQDVVKRARDLAAAPFDSSIPPLPDGLATLDFDAWRDIRFKSDKPLLGQEGANFRLELFHLGPSLQAPGGRQRAARRHPGADPLRRQSVRLRPHQARRRPADQPRFCRLSSALSDQRAARLGRGDRVSRHELLPLPRPRPALWPVGAGPCDRRRARASTRSSRSFANSGSRRRTRRPSTSSSTRCSTANWRPAPSASI